MTTTEIELRNPEAAATIRGIERAVMLPEGSVHPLGFELTDVEMTFDEWHAFGVRLSTAQNWTRWALGDWWNWGTGLFGEDMTTAVVGSDEDRMGALLDQVDLSPETIKMYARVCEAVARSRRRADLKFRHHAAVYKLEPAEQDVWLQRAADEKWTSDRLREEMRALKTGDNAVLPPADDNGGTVGPSRLDQAIGIITASHQQARPTGFGAYEVSEEIHAQWSAFLGNDE